LAPGTSALRARQHRDLQVVGQADAKHRCGARWLEIRLRAERRLDLLERRSESLHQRQCALGRFHHASLAHQQRIARELAQPRQRMAHRGLPQVQPLRSPADVALAHERRQHREQIQIHAVEFDRFHSAAFAVIDPAHSQYHMDRFP
jgi:hypothetical protein